MGMRMTGWLALGLGVSGAVLFTVVAAGATTETSQDAAALRGDADRGRVLFEAYTCYGCHGYTGETGFGPRLNPPRHDQAEFVQYLRNPRNPRRMPPYQQDDASDQKLADIFAYLTSLPSASPEAESIPLLQAILTGDENADNPPH
jgi:mono/diheme cytochrome c family protein|tara:strand:+ start:5353 stop:5790 length:438 start_codon:yes stop_codon:yes gene_type:complete